MSKRTGLGRGLGAFFGNDYEDAEAGKSSAKPSDEAGKKTSVRETEQEIEKKSLEELDMVLPGSKIGVCRKDSCENSGKRQPRGSCKGIRKDDGRRKNPHSRGDGGKIEDTDGKSGAGRKDG